MTAISSYADFVRLPREEQHEEHVEVEMPLELVTLVDRPQTSTDAFDTAQAFLADHALWSARVASEREQREERRELLRIASLEETPAVPDVSEIPAEADAVRTTSPEERFPHVMSVSSARARPLVNQQTALIQVKSATGLPVERCRFYLEQNDWDADKTIANIVEVGAATGSRSVVNTIELTFIMSGVCATESFTASQSGFDLYLKGYNMVTDKDRPFNMEISGPRDSDVTLSKMVDEGTWSLTLTQIGLSAGSSYDVAVTQ